MLQSTIIRWSEQSEPQLCVFCGKFLYFCPLDKRVVNAYHTFNVAGHSIHNILYIDWTLFQTQRWSLQHGTTTASYTGSFGVESLMELVNVIGKSSISH